MATEEIIPGFSAVPVDGAVVQNLPIKEEEEQEKVEEEVISGFSAVPVDSSVEGVTPPKS